jgi:predicted ester cyclase
MINRTAIRQLRRQSTPELLKQIRREWEAHALAEDQRDIPGLLATMTEDCVYELGNVEKTWRGHAGVVQFYTELLTAFPDLHFALKHIVIGPQGVFEEAHSTATQQGDWLQFPASGERVEFDVIIYFPWDMERQKFGGERVYFFNLSPVGTDRLDES